MVDMPRDAADVMREVDVIEVFETVKIKRASAKLQVENEVALIACDAVRGSFERDVKLARS